MLRLSNAAAVAAGVFICRGREDALVTKNLVPGESVYGEKRVSIEVGVLWLCVCAAFYQWLCVCVGGQCVRPADQDRVPGMEPVP